MIEVTRLNGTSYILNCELIKSLEATPDTVITLTTGEKFMVKEGVDAIVEATFQFRRKLYQNIFPLNLLNSIDSPNSLKSNFKSESNGESKSEDRYS